MLNFWEEEIEFLYSALQNVSGRMQKRGEVGKSHWGHFLHPPVQIRNKNQIVKHMCVQRLRALSNSRVWTFNVLIVYLIRALEVSVRNDLMYVLKKDKGARQILNNSPQHTGKCENIVCGTNTYNNWRGGVRSPMHTPNNWKSFPQIHLITKKIMLTKAN